ncbi:hypothetical protein HKCCSP123_14555 [Rhodobacterales bacterium HKCCSP123]|nr:hypothetical protein [Rhodobacterales bacterium HKCCSP123]
MERDAIGRQPDATRRGFAFDDVMQSFPGPDRVTPADPRRDDGEGRWVTFGEIEHRLRGATATMRGEVMRITQARKPTRPTGGGPTRTVRRTVDQGPPRRPGAEAKARHDAMRDEEIDHSETPDLGEVDWTAGRVEMPRGKPR